MIGSILRGFQSQNIADAPKATGDDAVSSGMTRSGFLKIMTAGTLVAGFGSSACARSATKPGRVPPVTDIDALYDAWQNRMNAGDLDGLVDLYLDDVIYVNPEGVLLQGKAAVRKDFEGILALKPQIVLGDRKHIVYHDVALTTNHWRMTFTGPDDVRQEMTGGGIEVMRKQSDGGWRYIIDDASRSASK